MIGQNLFDFLHNKDIAKVKDQLATSEHVPKERYIDTKTMQLIRTRLPHAHLQLHSGGRRQFICRMKRNVTSAHDGSMKQEFDYDVTKMREKRRTGCYCVTQ